MYIVNIVKFVTRIQIVFILFYRKTRFRLTRQNLYAIFLKDMDFTPGDTLFETFLKYLIMFLFFKTPNK